MKTKHFWVILLLFGLSTQVFAQKIGYANLELVLAYLPETQQVGQQLQTFQANETKKLESKRNYFDTKYQEYAERAQAGATEQDLLPLQQELQKLQNEIQQQAARVQQQIAQKQGELMGPILEKVEGELKKIAEEKGYVYILNASASGSSVVLHGNDADEVSKLLLTRLGVEVD